MRPGEIEIDVQVRNTEKHAGFLRRHKIIPGVVYGTVMKKSRTLQTDEKMVLKYVTRHYENTIFKLKSADADLNGLHVLLKEVARNPVNQRPIHLDFLAIDLNKPVRVPIELRFEGKPVGLAEGGVLQPLMRELEVWCLPAQIPEFISIDVSNLKVMDSVHIKDLTLPAGVTPAAVENLALVQVTVMRDEEPAAVAAAAATAAEPEVIGKGKKDEAAAPATAAPAAPAKK
jgi:large subunit ribosomal protein L25